MSKDELTESAKNERTLADLLTSGKVTTHQQVKIMNKLLEGRKHEGFFEVMFHEKMSLTGCPNCGHQNHWFIPEDVLNRMGWVTAYKDAKVKLATTAEDCPKYQEACVKRKTNA